MNKNYPKPHVVLSLTLAVLLISLAPIAVQGLSSYTYYFAGWYGQGTGFSYTGNSAQISFQTPSSPLASNAHTESWVAVTWQTGTSGAWMEMGATYSNAVEDQCPAGNQRYIFVEYKDQPHNILRCWKILSIGNGDYHTYGVWKDHLVSPGVYAWQTSYDGHLSISQNNGYTSGRLDSFLEYYTGSGTDTLSLYGNFYTLKYCSAQYCVQPGGFTWSYYSTHTASCPNKPSNPYGTTSPNAYTFLALLTSSCY